MRTTEDIATYGCVPTHTLHRRDFRDRFFDDPLAARRRRFHPQFLMLFNMLFLELSLNHRLPYGQPNLSKGLNRARMIKLTASRHQVFVVDYKVFASPISSSVIFAGRSVRGTEFCPESCNVIRKINRPDEIALIGFILLRFYFAYSC